MDYTINQLAKLAGVTTRTLRYYDQISLLQPDHINHSGYRIYGQAEIDKLQHILFFRELEITLEDIRQILEQPERDYLTLLSQHREALNSKKQRIEGLIDTIDQTISSHKGEIIMTNQQKFTAFKKDLVTDNEKQYGQEIREKYGDSTIDQANAKMLNLSEAQYQEWQATEANLLDLLSGFAKLEIPSATAEMIFKLHKEWLRVNLPTYNSATHKGIASMYTADSRFTAYYDEKAGVGAADFLNQVIHYYA